MKIMNEQSVTVTVTDKGIKHYGNTGDKYLIYTDSGTYEVTDSLYKWRWNSSDVYGSIVVGETYNFTIAGYRIPMFSKYQNIYEVELIEE